MAAKLYVCLCLTEWEFKRQQNCLYVFDREWEFKWQQNNLYASFTLTYNAIYKDFLRNDKQMAI